MNMHGKRVCSSFLLLLLSALGIAVASGTTTRTLDATQHPLRVVVTAQPPPGTSVWTLEEQLPANAVAMSLSHSGVWDGVNGVAKWGPFFDASPRQLEYRLVLPAGASGLVHGAISADGTDAAVAGTNLLPAASRTFRAWQLEVFGPEGFFTYSADPLFDGDRDTLPNIHEYAFAGDPAMADAGRLPRLQIGPDGERLLAFSAPRNALEDIIIEVWGDLNGEVLALYFAADWMEAGSGSVGEVRVPLASALPERIFVRVGLKPFNE